MAHPDDAEILSGGTLTLLHQKGWQVAIATMTPGQCGSVTFDANQISTIRRKEAAAAADSNKVDSPATAAPAVAE